MPMKYGPFGICRSGGFIVLQMETVNTTMVKGMVRQVSDFVEDIGQSGICDFLVLQLGKIAPEDITPEGQLMPDLQMALESLVDVLCRVAIAVAIICDKDQRMMLMHLPGRAEVTGIYEDSPTAIGSVIQQRIIPTAPARPEQPPPIT